jgi:hypothetical protein
MIFQAKNTRFTRFRESVEENKKGVLLYGRLFQKEEARWFIAWVGSAAVAAACVVPAVAPSHRIFSSDRHSVRCEPGR